MASRDGHYREKTGAVGRVDGVEEMDGNGNGNGNESGNENDGERTVEEMREEKTGFLAYIKTRDFWILLVAG